MDELIEAQKQLDAARVAHAIAFLAKRHGPLDDRLDAESKAREAIAAAIQAARKVNAARERLAADIIGQIGM